MSKVKRPRSPVYRQLEAYGESWKGEHADAMACRDWEDICAVGLSIFQMVYGREQAWRDHVFRGTISFADEDNLDQQKRWSDWLCATQRVLEEVVAPLESQFGTVEGAGQLRDCVARAEEILRKWQPPRLSMAVGLREMTLSPEAAAEMERIVAEARSGPPEIVPSHPIQEIPVEEFLRRVAAPGRGLRPCAGDENLAVRQRGE